ncbi:MAG: hypothetical protein HOI42_13860 [Candidatus Marinimicrobia bacterium]|jgi:hypothetical protein|nr:hypothetical protein [Candidatus Neomarinimicrobiota bacterium]
MANDITITFKAPTELADLLGKTAFDIDKGKSEVIRACILLSIDTVQAVPSLVNRIQIEDRKSNNI